MNQQSVLGIDAGAPRFLDPLSVIGLGGEVFLPDLSGALYWPVRRTLIVADLHLEKGAAFARRGSLLPPYDTQTTLALLTAAVVRHQPERVIALGDSFHDVSGAGRLARRDVGALHVMQRDRDWVWIAGNHDPELPRRIGGRVAPALTIGGITFVHEPGRAGPARVIAGHLHPAAKLRHGSGSVRRKCFASDGSRLVLPAFGAYAGGLNVLDAAFAPVFARRPFLVWMLGTARVYPLARGQLIPD